MDSCDGIHIKNISKLLVIVISSACCLCYNCKLSNLASSPSLYHKVADDFMLVSLSKVMGSTTQKDSVLILLIAT